MKRHSHKIAIIYNKSKVNPVTAYCYLSSIIDQYLSIPTNFDPLYKKAAARLQLLSYVRRYLTRKAFELYYKLMNIPLLTYWCSAIKTTYTRTQIMKLDSLEGHLLKVIGDITATKTWWYGKTSMYTGQNFLEKTDWSSLC